MDFSSEVLSYLVSVSIRSLGLAALALTVVAVCRIRSAAARHAMCTAVLTGMLALAALSPLLPAVSLRILRPVATGPDVDIVLPAVPPTPSASEPVAVAPPHITWRDVALGVYALGVLASLVRLLFSYLFTRRLLKASRRIELPWPHEAYESTWISVPITVGWLRPRILLPLGWERWAAPKLEAVMAHEGAHVRRGDWMVQLLAGWNRCLFWFHPLSWWLERKLAFLAEHACDDAALLEVGTAPYAEALLEMASAVKAGQGRLVWEAMAMANVAEVKHRIERILDETRQIPTGLTRLRWLALVAMSLPLIYFAAAVQLAPARAQQAVEPPRKSAVSPSPMVDSLRGKKLTREDAAALEQHLLSNPNDLDARAQLILYYYDNGIREPRLSHIFWLVANHPESTQAIFASRGIIPRTTALNDVSDYERAAGLWKQQAASHANDPRVLANAADFLSQPGGDIEEAERLLKAARNIQPDNSEWANRLAIMYAAAILRSSGDPRYVNDFPAFANRVKAELENSSDTRILLLTGRILAGVGLRPQPGQKLPNGVLNLDEHPALVPVVEMGNRLLSRTPTYSMSTGFAGQVIMNGPPAASPAAADLTPAPAPVSKVDPVYPPLARQARISGIVKLSVIIGPDGHVSKIEVISGHPLLIQSTLEAVKQWVFPGTSSAEPMLLVVPFQLDGSDAPPPQPQAQTAPTRVRVGAKVQEAKLINKVDPIYPEQARANGIEGDVELDITIDPDGHVEAVQVRDGHPLLATAAADAVRQYTYQPTLLNGNSSDRAHHGYRSLPSQVGCGSVAQAPLSCATLPSMKRLLLLALAVSLLVAQNRMTYPLASKESGHVALGLALRKLAVSGTFMQTPAHPDDENNALFAMFTYGMGLRSIDVQTKRGDGGQNEIGPELFRDMAVLRTSELLAAHRIDGAEQYFTRAIDYGYSFDPQEVIEKWGREEIVGDFVRLIRTFRPDVMLTMNIQGRGGDRAHEATTVLTREAYQRRRRPRQVSRADPRRAASLAAAEALFHRHGTARRRRTRWTARRRSRTAPRACPAPQVKLASVNTGMYDPLLGRTYAEIGSDARSQS